jgi:hypothetical protein
MTNAKRRVALRKGRPLSSRGVQRLESLWAAPRAAQIA